MLQIMESNANGNEKSILIEDEIKFKQGLRSTWKNHFVSVSKNIVSVYGDKKKENLLFTFHSSNSWISASNSSDTGLFFLHIESDTKLYLFETGSDSCLRKWLDTLYCAGWKSPYTNNNYISKKNNFNSKVELLSDVSTVIDHQKSSSLQLDESKRFSNFDEFQKELEAGFLERSFSMPSLIPQKIDKNSLTRNCELDLQNCDALKRRHYINIQKNDNQNMKNEDSLRVIKSGTSESGYCSKESLLIDQNDHRSAKTKIASKQDAVGPNIREEGNDITSEDTDNNENRSSETFTKHYYDNNLEDVFHDGKDDVILADVDDPEATPKLEKKPSMTQILSNLKSKFGTASSRRKGKKTHKRIARNDVYSGRLLWNPNGQWKDKWFFYQDGLLRGFKEVGFKPADVSIDVKRCRLTVYSADDMLRRLNIFKLTTSGDVVHMFAAWNEEQYDSWLEFLTYSVFKREEITCSFTNVDSDWKDKESESDENFIIPYDRALIYEEQKSSLSSEGSNPPNGDRVECAANTNSDVTTDRVDSIDSGNDGDESGLESSLSTLRYETKKLMNERLRQSPIFETVYDVPGIAHTKNISTSTLSLSLEKGSKKKNRNEQLLDKISPTLEITPSSDESLKNAAVTNRQKRPNSHYGGMKGFPNSNITRNDEHLQLPSNNYKKKHVNEYDNESNVSQPVSLDSPSSVRNNKIDRVLNQQSPLSENPNLENNWENFHQHKKSNSEDEQLEYFITDDKKQFELEDTLREDTILRTRRNSLRLKRDQIHLQIETIKAPLKKSNKNENLNISNEETKIKNLSSCLEDIEMQLDDIDKRINFRTQPEYQKKRDRGSKVSTAFMGKLRLTGKNKNNINTTNSMSVESLASSGSRDSRDSSLSHDSNTTREELNEPIPENFIAPPRKRDSSYIPPVREAKLSGIEELLLTTKKLEQGKNLNNDLIYKRSKSVGSMDKIISHYRQTSEPVKEDFSPPDQSKKIIEDFERFSEMLSTKMNSNQNGGNVIEV